MDGKKLSSETIHRGQIIDLTLDRVELSTGHRLTLEMVHHPGAAAVVAIDSEGCTILVDQYRYATGGRLLEVPAGKLDGGESPERCAAREVEEETGYRSGRLDALGWIWTAPGFTDEKIWLFLARELEQGIASPQPDELLNVVRLPFEEALVAACDGRISDAKSICALMRARALLLSGR